MGPLTSEPLCTWVHRFTGELFSPSVLFDSVLSSSSQRSSSHRGPLRAHNPTYSSTGLSGGLTHPHLLRLTPFNSTLFVATLSSSDQTTGAPCGPTTLARCDRISWLGTHKEKWPLFVKPVAQNAVALKIGSCYRQNCSAMSPPALDFYFS